MSSRQDVVVIGSGINSLVCATLLAKKGRKVLVLEKRASLGGLASSDEFHPGFKTAGVFNDTTQLRPWVIEQLGLKHHGLKLRSEEAPIFAPSKDGRGLLLWRNADRAQEEIGPLSQKDAKAYKEYRAFVDRVSPFLKKVFDDFPPDIMTMSFPGLWDLMKKAVSLRMLGRADMMEILRIAPMCVADWLNEYFESDLLKAALAGPAIYNSFTGPWSPGTCINLLMAEAVAQNAVAGGPQALAKAVLAAAKAANVEIRANTEVKQIVIQGTKATAVKLASGEEIAADRIVAGCDPKQVFLNLIEPAYLTQSFEHNIKNIRARGTTAKLDLALKGYPEFKERPSLKVEYVHTGEYFDQMERAFDAVKYDQHSDVPLLDVYFPTLEAPELAPAGHHVAQILVHFAPEKLAGGWTAEKKKAFEDLAVKAFEQYAPNVRSLIVASRLSTPADLAQDFNLSGGHLFHGEHAADQLLVRPTPECSRYATPYEGLYLCGSGSHPGGGLTGAPGGLAARTIYN
jgi:phytoene dehydrogenase-like protein